MTAVHDPGNSAGGGADGAPPATEEGSEPPSAGAAAEASDAGRDGAAKRKRKRKRNRKRSSADAPVAVPGVAATMASLSSGLLSHIDERHVPCSVDGCDRTWTWTAAEQIQAFGQPPPRRMCAEHEAKTGAVEDREVPCRNPGCDKSWTFTRAAALAQLQRTGSATPPRRVCDDCASSEKDLTDREVRCRIDACRRTWTWTADAQLKHRTWLRRQTDDAPPRGKRGRRGRKRGSIHDPPSRLCEACQQKLAKLTPQPGPCKVHGCTRTAMVDKEQQLRAWAALHTDDLDAQAPLPRRMCEVCREFCRTHPDREVPCGRPACDETWTYKTGAQLQASLAGRHEDPVRLCDECVRGGFAREPRGPDGSEIMPCVVPLCEGVWHYLPGTQLATARLGELPIDRMCEAHRREHAPAGASDHSDATATTDTPSST